MANYLRTPLALKALRGRYEAALFHCHLLNTTVHFHLKKSIKVCHLVEETENGNLFSLSEETTGVQGLFLR